MTAIAYTVVATLPDEATASEYVAWLRRGHVDAVLRGGAGNAVIVRLQEPAQPIRVETRYVFPDRATFDRYLARTAPELRTEGLTRFGPDRGVAYQRTVGEVQ
jgi:hypothetical protein